MEKELKELESKLKQVEDWEKRRDEINRELQDVLLDSGSKLDGSDFEAEQENEEEEQKEEEQKAITSSSEDKADVEVVPVVEEEDDNGSRDGEVIALDGSETGAASDDRAAEIKEKLTTVDSENPTVRPGALRTAPGPPIFDEEPKADEN